MHPILRFTLDLAPLAVFFLCYRFGDLWLATGAIIAATALSLLISYLVDRRIALMPLVSGVVIFVFGGLTLAIHDETFIKMKPTLVNLIFASLLLGGLYLKKPTLQYVMAGALQLSPKAWNILTRRWGVYFLFLAVLNECIWRNFPTEFWVNFKVFGMLTLTMVFSLAQMPLIKREWVEETKV